MACSMNQAAVALSRGGADLQRNTNSTAMEENAF